MECSSLVVCQGLVDMGASSGFAMFLSLLISVVVVSTVPLATVIVLIWVERKIAARIQDRIGPNRVGPYGLLQTFADMIKLITKETITPAAADRLLYNFAPLLSFVAVLLIWAVIPFTPYHVGVNLDIGALYFVAVASLGTLAVMTAGWASNNKYALLGAFRVIALLISYEVPLALSLLIPVMLAGSMNMQNIIFAQDSMWFFFMAPLATVIFFISSQAETGRAPFDLIEAESELVAGFNIEYSGMKFGMFFAGEFLHVFTNGVLIAILFFGGWLGPFYDSSPILAFVWLGLKTSIFYFISLWIRNTVPRFRIDQVMKFNWFFLVPVSIVNLIIISGLLKVLQLLGIAPQVLQGAGFVELLPMTLVLFIGNLAMAVFVMGRLRGQGRNIRLAEESAAGHDVDEIVPAHAAGD